MVTCKHLILINTKDQALSNIHCHSPHSGNRSLPMNFCSPLIEVFEAYKNGLIAL